jgi:tetratricopeptide (TPR) repeat protein
MSDAQPRNKLARPAFALAVILAAALAARVIFLAQLARSETGGVLSLDSRFYYDLAGTLSTGGSFPAGAIDFNPLYPAFLAIVFKLFGEGLLAPRIIQLALGLLTVALVYFAGLRLAGRPRKAQSPGTVTGLVAAAMAVLYAQFVLYEGMLLSTSLEVFFLAASFALALALEADMNGEQTLMLHRRPIPTWLSGFVLGAICGAGALGRPNLFLLLVAALPIWLCAKHRGRRAGLMPALGVLVGAAILLAPPIVHNMKATGRLVPVTAQGGINFYLGNRSGSTGFFQGLDGARMNARGILEESRAMAEAETGRSMTQAEASDYYSRRALDDIRANPAAWLRLLAKKLELFLNGVELYDVPSVYFDEKSCGVLKSLFLPFAVIAPLGVCGLLVFLRSGRNRGVVSIFLGCAVLSVLLFYVNTRYRLPAVPLLILLAAYFVVWIARSVSGRRMKEIAIMAAAAAALFFLVSHRSVVKVNHSAAYAFLGNHYVATKNEPKAEEAFAEAYRLDPGRIEATLNYARILGQRGKGIESAGMYARAYDRMPRFPRVAVEYGLALARLGRSEDAKRLFIEAASSNRPQDRNAACRILAKIALEEKNRDEAIRWLRRVLENEPGDAETAGMLRRLESGDPPRDSSRRNK